MDQAAFPQQKKLRVGWFSFTCCEDSTILFTELLNDHFDEWKKLVDFKYIHQLKSTNDPTNLDVAFIEGALSSVMQEQKVLKIREQAKYVVAVGACACTGLPSATRNSFVPEQITQRIEEYMKTFNYNQKVKKLDEVIRVDDMVYGCPMNVQTFQAVLEKYLKLFQIIP